MKRYALLALLLSMPAYAVLSPLNQSAVEIEAILKSSKLQELLPQSAQIMEIEKIENGYLVKTKGLVIEIEVVSAAQKHPGAKPFELNFKEPLPR